MSRATASCSQPSGGSPAVYRTVGTERRRPRRGTKPREDRALRHRQRGRKRTGPVHGAKPRSCRNSKGATATATWCGCGEGASSEGYETASRGRSHTARGAAGNGSISTGDGAVHRQRWSRVGTAPNAANPRSAAGCNKPATVARRKPSRWCKTTRAERDFRGGTSEAEVGSRGPAGVDAQRHVGGGVTNPTGGGR